MKHEIALRGLQRVAILGVPIVNLTMDKTLAVVEQMIDSRTFHQIATANADFLLRALRDRDLMGILQRCDLVLPDGMPLVWASELMGTPLDERVCGSDLVPRLMELSSRKNYGIFILGASEERSLAAVQQIAAEYPNARLVGRYSPPMASLQDMDHEHILGLIEEAKPDILLVAFGNPKQEKWISMHRNKLKVPVCVGVGGSIDFLSGLYSRAPTWMQKSGLEWLHRLAKEPGRLTGRYASNVGGLIVHLPKQLLAYALQSRTLVPSSVTRSSVEGVLQIAVSGRFTGALVLQVQEMLGQALADSSHLILDLKETTYVGADAYGMIIHLDGKLNNRSRQFWLAGARPSLLRVHRTSRIGKHILLAQDASEAMAGIGMSTALTA